jgi:hypothetical protein
VRERNDEGPGRERSKRKNRCSDGGKSGIPGIGGTSRTDDCCRSKMVLYRNLGEVRSSLRAAIVELVGRWPYGREGRQTETETEKDRREIDREKESEKRTGAKKTTIRNQQRV